VIYLPRREDNRKDSPPEFDELKFSRRIYRDLEQSYTNDIYMQGDMETFDFSLS
jgi:hypothetical protein